MQHLQGGKFGSGFAAAGVTQALSGQINTIDAANPIVGAAARVSAAAVLGGTVSDLTGGKFANGAITAAFSQAFNHELTGDAIRRNTTRIETLESTQTEDFDDFSLRVGSRLVTLTEETGFEYTAGFGKREADGYPGGMQYGAIVQTQGSHIFSAVVYMPARYQNMHNSSGHVLRLHSHGLTSIDGRGIRANDMDLRYMKLGVGTKIRPYVPRQYRYDFSSDDAATRGGLAYPGGIKWWPGEGHD